MATKNDDKMEATVKVLNPISKQKVMIITKQMIADLKNDNVKNIKVKCNLEKCWGFDETEKKELENHIDEYYFKEYEAESDENLLATAVTVRDLVNLIYNHFIPAENRK